MKRILLFAIALMYFSFSSQSQVPSYVPTNGLVAWYPFDGNANDESGNTNNGTIVSSVPFIDDRNGQSQSAIELGAGVVTMPQSIFEFQRDESFTISCWFTHESSGNARLLSTECPEGNFRIANWTASGEFAIQYGDYLYNTLTTPTNWNHLVYTYDNRNENVYINGQLVISSYDNSVEALNYCNPFTVGGKASNNGNDRWNGNVDDIGLWNKALTQQEVTDLYTGGNCLPAYIPTNGLVAWYPFCGNANDESGNGNNGAASGALLTSDRFGNPNAAYNFDGVNDYIEVPHSQDLDFSVNQEMSISYWVNISQYPTSGTEYQVIMKVDGGGTTTTGYQIALFDDGHLELRAKNGAVNPWVGIDTESSTIPLSGYHHFVSVIENESAQIYMDGVLQDDDSYIGAAIGANTENLIIGWNNAQTNGTSVAFAGELDDIGIWDRALTVQEVTDIYSGSVTVGIDENSETEPFKIYPNPTEGLVNLYTNDLAGLVAYRILDTKGSVVAIGSFTAYQNHQETVDLSTMPTGIYAIQMQSGDAVFTQKLVKR